MSAPMMFNCNEGKACDDPSGWCTGRCMRAAATRSDYGVLRYQIDGEWYARASDLTAAEARVVELEAAQRLHAGDTLSLSNELDEWRDRANDAERNFEISIGEMRRKDALIEAAEAVADRRLGLLQEALTYLDNGDIEDAIVAELTQAADGRGGRE